MLTKQFFSKKCKVNNQIKISFLVQKDSTKIINLLTHLRVNVNWVQNILYLLNAFLTRKKIIIVAKIFSFSKAELVFSLIRMQNIQDTQ